MNKQQTLITVFNFIAEFLKEDELVKEPKSEPKIDSVEPTEINEQVLGVPTSEILEFMRKVDNIGKSKPNFEISSLTTFIIFLFAMKFYLIINTNLLT